jgi:hypothetical protein
VKDFRGGIKLQHMAHQELTALLFGNGAHLLCARPIKGEGLFANYMPAAPQRFRDQDVVKKRRRTDIHHIGFCLLKHFFQAFVNRNALFFRRLPAFRRWLADRYNLAAFDVLVIRKMHTPYAAETGKANGQHQTLPYTNCRI